MHTEKFLSLSSSVYICARTKWTNRGPSTLMASASTFTSPTTWGLISKSSRFLLRVPRQSHSRVFSSQLLLLMGLRRNTSLHWDASGVHSTHSSLGRYIIGGHPLGLYSLHPHHRHLPRNIPIWNNMGALHVPRNCVLNRLRRLHVCCAFKISSTVHWPSRIIDSFIFRTGRYKCITAKQRLYLEVSLWILKNITTPSADMVKK